MKASPAQASKQQLYQELTAQLLGGAVLPGQALPSQRLLAADYCLSRESVREVIQQLELDGLITTRPGGRSVWQNLLACHDDLGSGGGDNLDFQLQVLEARAFLEGEAAFYAAKRASDSQLAEIAAEFQRMQQRSLGETTLDKARADLTFHMMIAKASHHVLIAAFSDLFYRRYFNAIYGVLQRTLARFGRYPEGIRHQHEQIFEALSRRDAAQARSAARAHIRYTRRQLENSE